MKDNIEILNKIITDNNLTIFCGSGISFNSNVPGVGAIINSLVDPLIELTPSFSHEWAKRIRDADRRLIIQFEVIMGYFRQEIGNDTFSDFLERIFDTNINGYIPNSFHKSIAALAQKGKIKNIYTTNFDTLIEQALQDAKIAFVSITENDILDNNVVNVIKIHGCISKPSTILTTMQEVSKSANKLIAKLNNCFAGEGVVLFLGYSCSDFADIKPAVRMAGKNNVRKKQIVVLNHCVSESRIIRIDDLNNRTDTTFQIADIEKIKSYFIDDNPQNCFNGLIIRGDTKVLPICLNIPYDEKIDGSMKSSLYVDFMANYYKKQKEYKIYWIIGNICEKLGEFIEAITYIRHSLILAERDNEQLSNIVRIKMDLAVALYRNSDHNEAIRIIGKCIEDAILCFGYNSEEVAQLYDNWGLNYVHIQDGELIAIDKHTTALNIVKTLNNKKAIRGNIYNNLGNAYFAVRDYFNSLQCYNSALDIFKDLYSEQDSFVATVMNNIGGVHLKLNNFEYAHKFYADAYEIWEHTLSSNHPNIAIAIANIGDVFYRQKEYREACCKQLSALRIRLRTLNYPHFDLFESYEKLGDCFYKLKQLPVALKCYTKAKDICKHNKDIPELTKKQIERKLKLLTILN